jgi:hypothetical protein
MLHHFANDRISVISGISVSQTRGRLGLFGMFFWEAQQELRH